MRITENRWDDAKKFEPSESECTYCRSTVFLDEEDVHFNRLFTSLGIRMAEFYWECPLCRTGNAVLQAVNEKMRKHLSG